MREREYTSPMLPPATADTEDLRTLLARTALANPALMQGATDPDEAVARAIEVADRMIEALSSTEPPIVRCPSDQEMEHWEHALEDQGDERQHRDLPPNPRRAIPPPSPYHPQDGDTIPSPMSLDYEVTDSRPGSR